VKSLDRKLLRDLWGNKGMILAVTSIIALGVMCFVALQSAHRNLETSKIDYYQMCRMADFWVDLKKVPLAELDRVRAIRGVKSIESRISFLATADLEDHEAPLTGLMLSLPNHPGHPINDIVLRQGGYFSDEKENEVIVNDAFAKVHGLYPGRRLHLLLNNRREELLVVGTAISSEFVYLVGPGSIIPAPKTYGVFYLKHDFAEEVFQFEGAANQFVGKFDEHLNTAERDEILLKIERLLDDFGVSDAKPLSRQTSNQFLSGEIDGIGAFAKIVPLVFLTVAALLLNVLLTRLTRQQRTVIGTLKALGYSDRSIFVHFLEFGLCVGALGGLFGCILGYVYCGFMIWLYNFFFAFPRLENQFFPDLHLIGLSVSLICSLTGSAYGAAGMLRLNPAAAMRPEPPRVVGAIPLERITWLWSRLGSGTRMAFRTLFRQRFRTAVAIFASSMGAMLMTNGFMLAASQSFLVDFQFYQSSKADFDFALRDEQGREALDEIRALPGVDYVEPQFIVPCTLVNGSRRQKCGVTGLAPGARLTRPMSADGTPVPVPDRGLLLSTRLAEILNVQDGDSLLLIPARGHRRSVEVTVAAVFDSFLGLDCYADQLYLSRLIDEEFAMNSAQVLANQEPTALRALYREVKRLPGIQSTRSRRDSVRMLEETLLQNQKIFLFIITSFSGVIFCGSIINTSVVNLAERQREVATLRAIGYTPVEVGNIFLRENVATNLVGTLLGLPLGWMLTWLIARNYGTDLIRLPLVQSPLVWLETGFFAALFMGLAHTVVQYMIFKMNFVEALKVKE
jgi:putative ABC transport system permease protein